jgi:hypothetical protein
MLKALIAIVIVVALLAGLIMNLRKSARTGMPPHDVLKRATQRARELEAKEKLDEDRK